MPRKFVSADSRRVRFVPLGAKWAWAICLIALLAAVLVAAHVSSAAEPTEESGFFFEVDFSNVESIREFIAALGLVALEGVPRRAWRQTHLACVDQAWRIWRKQLMRKGAQYARAEADFDRAVRKGKVGIVGFYGLPRANVTDVWIPCYSPADVDGETAAFVCEEVVGGNVIDYRGTVLRCRRGKAT